MENEKRLVDANELLRGINNYFDNSPFPHPGTNWRRGFEFAAELILFAPTVDAVEVVRCKDCKHNVANKAHDPLDATDYTDIVCDYWMTDGNRPDDFCSYGERKEQ